MRIVANLMVALVALEHVAFLILEMFLWKGPIGRQVFGTTPEFAAQAAPLAANQALYNGFLAVGLLWALVARRLDLKVFFLSCVVVAGTFGGLTVKPAILYTQAAPAALALLLVLLFRSPTKRTRSSLNN